MAIEGEVDSGAESLMAALRVVSRHGSTARDGEEQAAALAVLSELLVEEANARHDAETGIDHWARSARALRSPVVPGPGAWRGFTG